MAERFLPNDRESLLSVSSPQLHLQECLEDIVTYYPPQSAYTKDETGLYLGPTGIAYLFLHLTLTHPTLTISGKSPPDWVTAYLSGTRLPSNVTDEHCGIITETPSFLAVSAAHTQDFSYVHELLSHLPQIISTRGSDEWCYGRSGFLYCLRLVRHWVPSSAPLIDPAIKSLIDCMISNGPDWVWRMSRISDPTWVNGKRLVGVGHGDIGILTQIILTDPSRAPQLEEKLNRLLDLQDGEGNWPYGYNSANEQHRVGLVQFCHGAPGVVISLHSIRPYFAFSPKTQERIDQAIERARALVWERGLLKKEPNLCHGVTGNAFAFPPGEKRDHFLAFGTKDMMEKGKSEGWWEAADYGARYALGFGSVPGRAWGWMARERDGGEYIAYNDI